MAPIDGNGEGLFRLACEHDLEGIVAKRKQGTYLPQEPSSWVKIRNRSYNQWVGREELSEGERGGDPDFRGWDDCVGRVPLRLTFASLTVTVNFSAPAKASGQKDAVRSFTLASKAENVHAQLYGKPLETWMRSGSRGPFTSA